MPDEAEQLDRLKAALANRYRIERELGAGGMAHVYLAEDVKHHRPVAIKVLRPELATALGPERFLREVEVTARLDHPHILALLDSGDADGFLFYVMPYVEGESLRDRLNREKQLPIDDALQITREVADALDFAHRHDVIHRDIKPENILLSEHHARVADFGIARAISAAGGDRLTETGLAVGTPEYMSPEQAAGESEIDGRSDVYALGCVLYEMLAGQPPFSGATIESVVRQHLSAEPTPITNVRATVPPSIANVLARSLAKAPADRYLTADTFAHALAADQSPAHPRWQHPVAVAALFGITAIAVLGLVYLLMIQLGLPDWVLGGAAVLLAVGVPIMVTTSLVERARITAKPATAGGGIRRWFTSRRAVMGGVLAFIGLGVVTLAFAAMRALGIGPAATLVSAGVFEERSRVIIADFENATSDSTLGGTVTELLRIDLAQSPTITVMEPSQVADVVARMEMDRDTQVSAEIAREVAEREGVKVYVAGEIRSVGDRYLISARLLAATTGDALVAAREEAAGSGAIIEAVDRISAHMRERIGESLRSVRQDPPLERITTASLDALRLYAQATRIMGLAGDADQAISLLEQAVELDSTFAMGYQRMAAYLSNIGRGRRADRMVTRAYQLRERLSDRERYHIEFLYLSLVEDDQKQAVTSLLALLEKYPTDAPALNNIAIAYGQLGRLAEAEEFERRSVGLGDAPAATYGNLISHQINLGKLAAADTTHESYGKAYAEHPGVLRAGWELAGNRWEYDEAWDYASTLLEQHAGIPRWETAAYNGLAAVARVRGRLMEAARLRERAIRSNAKRREWSREDVELRVERNRLEEAAWFPTDPGIADQIEAAWQRNLRFLADSAPERRPYRFAVESFADAGRPERAAELLQEYRDVLTQAGIERDNRLRNLEARVALSGGEPLRAAELWREARAGDENCRICWLAAIGYAYDLGGEVDSAVTYYERHLSTPWNDRLWVWDQELLALTLRRLGTLYEDRGERASALDNYTRFVELWKDADPELQPQVEEVKQRLARLVGEPQ